MAPGGVGLQFRQRPARRSLRLTPAIAPQASEPAGGSEAALAPRLEQQHGGRRPRRSASPTCPWIGIRTAASQTARTRGRTPRPRSRSRGSRRRPGRRRRGGRRRRRRRRSSRGPGRRERHAASRPGSGTTAIGRCSTAPADARQTAAVTVALRCRGTISPSAPAHSADARDRAEVVRVGDLVERHDQRAVAAPRARRRRRTGTDRRARPRPGGPGSRPARRPRRGARESAPALRPATRPRRAARSVASTSRTRRRPRSASRTGLRP